MCNRLHTRCKVMEYGGKVRHVVRAMSAHGLKFWRIKEFMPLAIGRGLPASAMVVRLVSMVTLKRVAMWCASPADAADAELRGRLL